MTCRTWLQQKKLPLPGLWSSGVRWFGGERLKTVFALPSDTVVPIVITTVGDEMNILATPQNAPSPLNLLHQILSMPSLSSGSLLTHAVREIWQSLFRMVKKLSACETLSLQASLLQENRRTRLLICGDKRNSLSSVLTVEAVDVILDGLSDTGLLRAILEFHLL